MCWVPLSARVNMCVLCPLRKRSFGEDDEEETESALLAARRPPRLVIVINWLAKQQSSFLKVRNYLYPVSKKACQLVDLVNNVSSSSWTVRGRWNVTRVTLVREYITEIVP